jgi:hypothetical protein
MLHQYRLIVASLGFVRRLTLRLRAQNLSMFLPAHPTIAHHIRTILQPPLWVLS